jgi:hypothetical protein
VLIIDAESSANSVGIIRRRNLDHFGYLPTTGRRRFVLLSSMGLFIGSYLLLAASTLAAAVQLFPPFVVATVLAADCGLHHVFRASAGDWWIVGDVVRSGVGVCIVDGIANCVLWTLAHACPIATVRDPNWTGSHNTARIVVCSLLEGAFVICTALLHPQADEGARLMALRICLPAMCVALTALVAFFAAMQPTYRRTFWARQSRQAWYRRRFDEWVGQPQIMEELAQSDLFAGYLQRHVGEPLTVWIEQHAPVWADAPPTWFTAEWRASVLQHAHLLPGDGAVRVAAALRCEGVEAVVEVRHQQGLATPQAAKPPQHVEPYALALTTSLWTSELEA